VSEISAYAPGRVELLGNHTDYNQGVVLAAAIDRGLTISGTGRADRRIRLSSDELGRTLEIHSDEIAPQVVERWANYALGVVDELTKASHSIPGFEARIRGNLPNGAGLSSSAAFEVATACFLIKLTGLRLPALELAKLCQRAENHFVGVQSGLLDQVTSVFGREDHVVYLDCQTDEVQTLALPSGLALVIAESGAKHSLIQGEYNDRRNQCRAAATALGISSLREINEDGLAAAQSSIDPLLFRRASHVVGENARVFRARVALAAGDAAEFGALMNASHESSRLNFENSSPELDHLVGLARKIPGVLGSRLTEAALEGPL
jgi:galactokinase